MTSITACGCDSINTWLLATSVVVVPMRLVDGNTIEAHVNIHSPAEEVFEFYRDFRNLPAFLGDVMAIEQVGPATSR